jgi:DNA-binding NarL/FixJ family response regulator
MQSRVQAQDASVAELLTARELQIAVLIAQGFAKRAIGRRLGVSAFTVATHLARTYSKLGVRNRSALAARIAGTVALHRRPARSAREADRALTPQ